MTYGYELMFDAANCMRLGKHILMNVYNENQALGAKWLKSVLGDDYTILPTKICDSHIDSEFLPLRPGLAIISEQRVVDLLPEPLQKWDLIFIPERDRNVEHYNSQDIKLASPKVELNVLSINPSTIICHPEYRDTLHTALSKYNIDVIPVQMRHCEIFAGAHHCLTLDIRRKGGLENYLQ